MFVPYLQNFYHGIPEAIERRMDKPKPHPSVHGYKTKYRQIDTHYLVSVVTHKGCQCHIDLLEYKLNTYPGEFRANIKAINL